MVNDDHLSTMSYGVNNLAFLIFTGTSYNTALHLTVSFEWVSPIWMGWVHTL